METGFPWRLGLAATVKVSAPPETAAVGGSILPTPRLSEGMSLRAKGLIAIVALILFTAGVGFFTEGERQKLLLAVDELERVHREEEQLVQINMSIARALLAVNSAYSAEELTGAVQSAVFEVDATRNLLEGLDPVHPRVLMLSHALQAIALELISAPSRGLLGIAREDLHELVTELDSITHAARARKLMLLNDYRATYDRVTLEALALAVLGIVVMGAVIAKFFSRMTWDIREVEERAMAIVGGYRGKALEVTRKDEIGGLMAAVNQMQLSLRERERHIERARREQFHREKMAAVGSLAAQLAHEINNPIAAISGIASTMRDVSHSHQCTANGRACQPGMILEHTQRIAVITRQLADFTRPRPQGFELLDLNQLVRTTRDFLAYDHRFRNIAFHLSLDPELPAVRSLGDHLTQTLMNLLINAADALKGCPPERRRIDLATHVDRNCAVITIADQGKGMDPETQARAFDEYFTTKPAGEGSGLGLALTRELMREIGATLELTSAPDDGATAVVRVPLEYRPPAHDPRTGAADASAYPYH
ncbi:MAG: GHKL domain-containing protein [Zoogloeaceae bacterium]|nr:GHKL domain-containing protein [Zoogloeaceae bacterium]